MARYSKEMKASIIARMMPPNNISVSELKKETGITDATLYTWRKQAKAQGLPVPGDGNNSEKWSPQDKFSVLTETASLNTAELSEYCRKHGLFVEQLAQWKQDFIAGSTQPADIRKFQTVSQRQDKQRIKTLERDVKRMEKALAETAALLVLSKKARAIWGESEED